MKAPSVPALDRDAVVAVGRHPEGCRGGLCKRVPGCAGREGLEARVVSEGEQEILAVVVGHAGDRELVALLHRAQVGELGVRDVKQKLTGSDPAQHVAVRLGILPLAPRGQCLLHAGVLHEVLRLLV